MDDTTTRNVCALFELGAPTTTAVPVVGGFMHRMWRVETAHGVFAVKELNRNFDDPLYIEWYERAFVLEHAALDAGVPMPRPIPAVATGSCLVEVPGTGERPMTVRAHEWVDGETLDNSRMHGPEDVRQVAVMMARIHALRMTSKTSARALRTFGDEHWRTYVDRADDLGEPWAPVLRAMLPVLHELEAYVEAADADPTPLLMSHNDSDKRNMLRTPNGRLVLVDWDAAGPVNPRHDVVNYALIWAGVWLGEPDARLANAFVDEYRSAGGGDFTFRPHDVAELVSKQLTWFNFNVRRAFGEHLRDASDRQAGVGVIRWNSKELPRFARSLDAWLTTLTD
jgi:thiamine kinase-like enzyme